MCALRISKDRYLHADVQYNNQSGRWIEMRLIDLVVEKRREEKRIRIWVGDVLAAAD